MTSERKVFYIVSLTILFILTVAGLSYSFFMAKISGNESESTVYGVAANLTIEFREGTSQINATDIFPGWSETKTFSVKNNNAGQGEYALYIFDIENDFMEESISFEITSTNGGATISNMKLPLSGKKTLDAKVTILGNTTQEYTVKVKYDYLDVNQEIDKGKSFSFKVGIREAGYEMTNLIKNGDFSDGANGWSMSMSKDPLNDIDISENEWATEGGSAIFQYFSTVSSHMIYAKTNIRYYSVSRDDETGTGLRVYNADETIAAQYILPSNRSELIIIETCENYSLLYTATATEQYLSLGGDGGGDVTNGSYFGYSNVLVVDLTETFGAGNEPTKEWCDANISWFDGTTIINK